MFKLSKWTKLGAIPGLIACAVLFSGANPGVGYAAPQVKPMLFTTPTLGTAGSYAVLGGSTVTNVPAAGTVLLGNLGVWPGLAITGFPPGIVVPPGTIHAGDAAAQSAQTDLTAAYNTAATQPCGTSLTGLDLGGSPANLAVVGGGVFCFSTSAQLTGSLTLDGNHVWIFQIGSTLTTASSSNVVLTNGASACNVFFQVGTSATLGTGTSFNGNILALSSITLNHGANVLSGRVLARNGAVTLDDNTVNASACSGVTPGGVGLSKIFTPDTITVGGVATVTILLTNAITSTTAITTPITDNLPSGVVIATPPNASTTCSGSSLSAPAGGSTIQLTGGTIPAKVGSIPGFCTITVNVTAVTPGNFLNTIGTSGTVLRVNAAPVAPSAPKEVPEGDTLLLFGGGIAGLTTWLGWQWRKVRARSK